VQEKDVTKIVSVIEVLQAMLSIVLRKPDDVRGRPRDYFKKNEQYASVFGKDKYDLNVYLRSIQIAKSVADYLDKMALV